MTYTIHTIEPANYSAAENLIKAVFTSPSSMFHDNVTLLNALREERTYDAALELVVKNQQDTIVGYGTLSDAYIQGQPTSKMAVLGPLMVAADNQGQGIGRQLIDELEHRAFVRGYQAVVATGIPDYFSLFGYEAANTFNITGALNAPENQLLLRELRPGALRHISGPLTYAQAFNQV